MLKQPCSGPTVAQEPDGGAEVSMPTGRHHGRQAVDAARAGARALAKQQLHEPGVAPLARHVERHGAVARRCAVDVGVVGQQQVRDVAVPFLAAP